MIRKVRQPLRNKQIVATSSCHPLRSKITSMAAIIAFVLQMLPLRPNLAHASAKPIIAIKMSQAPGLSDSERAKFYELVGTMLANSKKFKKILSGSSVESIDLSSDDDKRATAEKAFADAKDAVEKGKNAFDKLKSKEAIKQLVSAREKIEKHMAYFKDGEMYQDLLLYLVLAYKADGNPEKSKEILSQLAAIEPNLELDENLYSPKIIKKFEELKQARDTSKVGHLKIVSSQSGVSIFLNGKKRGEVPSPTPLIIAEIPVGDHHLLAEKEGFRPEYKKVTIASGYKEIRVEPAPTDWSKQFVPIKKTGGISPATLDLFHKFADHPKVLCDIVLLSTLELESKGHYVFRAQLFDARIDNLSPTLKIDLGPSLAAGAPAAAEMLAILLKYLNDLGEVTGEQQKGTIPPLLPSVLPAFDPKPLPPMPLPPAGQEPLDAPPTQDLGAEQPEDQGPPDDQVIPQQQMQQQQQMQPGQEQVVPQPPPPPPESVVAPDEEYMQKKKTAAWVLLGVVAVGIILATIFIFSGSKSGGEVKIYPPQ